MDLTINTPTPDQITKSKTGYLALDQTASRIEATVFFVDSGHHSVQAILAKDKRAWSLYYFYLFALPNKTYWGATMLTLANDRLKGKYWNTAGGQGEWKSTGHVPQVHTTRDAAVKAFAQPARPSPVA